MRRKDFEILDRTKAFQFLEEMHDGVLTTIAKNNSMSTRPMNFVRIGDDLYFHGARTGEKMDGIGQNSTFSVYRPLSLIPSYWVDELSACPATALFQSVILKGIFENVSLLSDKAEVLQKLMLKLQPEGKYLNFTENFLFYEKALSQVSVFILKSSEITYKVKLGQNWDMKKRMKIKALLLERNQQIDIETVEQMNNFGIFTP